MSEDLAIDIRHVTKIFGPEPERDASRGDPPDAAGDTLEWRHHNIRCSPRRAILAGISATKSGLPHGFVDATARDDPVTRDGRLRTIRGSAANVRATCQAEKTFREARRARCACCHLGYRSPLQFGHNRERGTSPTQPKSPDPFTLTHSFRYNPMQLQQTRGHVCTVQFEIMNRVCESNRPRHPSQLTPRVSARSF